MALFVRKMGKFMKNKGYSARKRRDHNKEYVRICYKYKSLDHIVVIVPTIVIMMRMRRRSKRMRRKKEREEGEENDLQEKEEGKWICSHLG